jgi:phage tail sheath protein FI
VSLTKQAVDANGKAIFSLLVTNNGQRVETFTNLSMGGIAGTRPVAQAVNDPLAGSRYISVTSAVTSKEPATTGTSVALAGGKDPALPTAAALTATEIVNAVQAVEGPLIASFQPFVNDQGVVVMPTAQQTNPFNTNRDDIFVIYDGNPVSLVSGGSTYTTDVMNRASSLGTADSYSALYAPWIIIPDPANSGGTISVPPSGAVTGIIARIDAQVGPWRAPAGVPATVANGLAAEVKFTDTDQGQLNYNNINVIRAVTGQGICVMGGRTRKLWGPDRYVSARRALIYIKESLRRSTQFAVFENNDANLWSALRQTANRILQPVWEAGGLKGSSTADAYFVRCDATINTPQVVASGEVRMEIGVALQYPAEFIIIRISQYDSGASVATTQIPTA